MKPCTLAVGKLTSLNLRLRSIGGYKGIIVRDDRLIGRTLCLRPSQNKFKAYFDNETARAYELAIAESFTRPGTLNLSRLLRRVGSDWLLTFFAYRSTSRQCARRPGHR